MKRKNLIPLLLFLLILLLILCVWCHSEDIMKQRAVNSSKIASPMSSPVIQKDIDFSFVKEEDNIELRGNFSTDKSVQILHTAIGNTQFNNLSHIDKSLLAKEELILFTQKLLLSFNKYYKSGSISYADGTLSIEGIVERQEDKNAIATLLANTTIASKNNTRVVIPGPTAEELAFIKSQNEAKARLLAEEKAKQEAEAQAKLLAKEKAKQEAEAKAKLLAEEKAKEEAEAQAKLLAEEKAKEEAQALEEKIKNLLTHEHINFELNKATLTEKSIDTVSHIAQILTENPNVHVEIAGHSDSLGNDNYNLKLSQQRVDTVKAKLIQMEIHENRLTAVGYGETQPLVSNDTEENRRINRRVEFKVLGE